MNIQKMEFIKNLVSEEIFETYRSIIEINSDSYALFIADGMSYSLKKSRKSFLEDQINIKLNKLIYMFNCIFNSERKDQNFEKIFVLVNSFISNFKKELKEFQLLLLDEDLDSFKVADLYLYYFALLTIYNNVFDYLDRELKNEQYQAREIDASMPIDKTIDECINDFNIVKDYIRTLKKDN